MIASGIMSSHNLMEDKRESEDQNITLDVNAEIKLV